MIEKIKKLMKKHDWFFEKSDDHRQWQNGLAEKAEIMSLMRQVPANRIPELIAMIPHEVRPEWTIELQSRPATLNTHQESNEESW